MSDEQAIINEILSALTFYSTAGDHPEQVIKDRGERAKRVLSDLALLKSQSKLQLSLSPVLLTEVRKGGGFADTITS